MSLKCQKLRKKNIFLSSWIDLKSLQHLAPCATSYGRTLLKILETRKMQSTFLTIQLEGAHTFTG
jgi:hypothetical protein